MACVHCFSASTQSYAWDRPAGFILMRLVLATALDMVTPLVALKISHEHRNGPKSIPAADLIHSIFKSPFRWLSHAGLLVQRRLRLWLTWGGLDLGVSLICIVSLWAQIAVGGHTITQTLDIGNHSWFLPSSGAQQALGFKGQLHCHVRYSEFDLLPFFADSTLSISAASSLEAPNCAAG